MKDRRLKVGDIARCRRGNLGLITDVNSEADGYKYDGVHLGKNRFGMPWESIDPAKVANINTLLGVNDGRSIP